MGGRSEALEPEHALERVGALLGYTRVDTTQTYASITPPQLKWAAAFCKEKAQAILTM